MSSSRSIVFESPEAKAQYEAAIQLKEQAEKQHNSRLYQQATQLLIKSGRTEYEADTRKLKAKLEEAKHIKAGVEATIYELEEERRKFPGLDERLTKPKPHWLLDLIPGEQGKRVKEAVNNLGIGIAALRDDNQRGVQVDHNLTRKKAVLKNLEDILRRGEAMYNEHNGSRFDEFENAAVEGKKVKGYRELFNETDDYMAQREHRSEEQVRTVESMTGELSEAWNQIESMQEEFANTRSGREIYAAVRRLRNSLSQHPLGAKALEKIGTANVVAEAPTPAQQTAAQSAHNHGQVHIPRQAEEWHPIRTALRALAYTALGVTGAGLAGWNFPGQTASAVAAGSTALAGAGFGKLISDRKSIAWGGAYAGAAFWAAPWGTKIFSAMLAGAAIPGLELGAYAGGKCVEGCRAGLHLCGQGLSAGATKCRENPKTAAALGGSAVASLATAVALYNGVDPATIGKVAAGGTLGPAGVVGGGYAGLEALAGYLDYNQRTPIWEEVKETPKQKKKREKRGKPAPKREFKGYEPMCMENKSLPRKLGYRANERSWISKSALLGALAYVTGLGGMAVGMLPDMGGQPAAPVSESHLTLTAQDVRKNYLNSPKLLAIGDTPEDVIFGQPGKVYEVIDGSDGTPKKKAIDGFSAGVEGKRRIALAAFGPGTETNHPESYINTIIGTAADNMSRDLGEIMTLGKGTIDQPYELQVATDLFEEMVRRGVGKEHGRVDITEDTWQEANKYISGLVVKLKEKPFRVNLLSQYNSRK